MHCHKARRRIIEAVRNGVGIDTIPELKSHLAGCHECDSFYHAELILTRDLEQAEPDDRADTISFNDLKSRVETAADNRGLPLFREITIMRKLTNTIWHRPKLSFSILGVLLLAFVTLVPLKFDDTIGYEVAIAGVDKNLALDESRLGELFSALGLSDADYEVGDCDQTCILKISDLNSENDLKIVQAAFDKMGNCTIQDVKEIQGKRSEPIVIYVKKKVAGGEISNVSEDDVDHFVVKCLDSLSANCNFGIWFTKDSGAQVCTYGHKMLVSIDSLGFGGCAGGDSCVLIDKSGHRSILNPDDPELKAKLEAMGVTLGDSACTIKMAVKQCLPVDGNTEFPTGDEDASISKDEAAQVPESFMLGQNYPNPFNPDTRIDYTLASADYVTLEIINMNGQVVRTLVDEMQSAGNHTVTWDATDDGGKRVASGVYLYRLQAGDQVDSKKMTLLK